MLNGGKYHYEINVFLKYSLDIAIHGNYSDYPSNVFFQKHLATNVAIFIFI